MDSLQIDNVEGLRLFFNEEVYVLDKAVEKLEPEELDVKFLGGNGQRILILLKDTLDKDLHAEERKLLMAILDAIKIKVPDYAIVFWDQHQHLSFMQIASFLQSEKILSFGMQGVEMGLGDLSFNQIQDLAGRKFILTSHLSALKNDALAKKAFWTQLKVLFT